MTKDRKKLAIFIVLLIVLGVTIAFGFRTNSTTTTSAAAPVQTPAPKTSAKPPAPSDARILEVERAGGEQQVGSRNLFQYRQAPAPALPPPPRGTFQNVNPAPPPQPVVTQPVARPTNPLPPPINLKYQGFAAANSQQPGLTAFLADDARHYNVTVGEVLMGRYRIASISDKSVEVEDLEYNRRQSLPLLTN